MSLIFEISSSKNGNKTQIVAFIILLSVFVLEQEVVEGLRLPWIHCLHILDCSIYGMGGGPSKIKVILKGCG